MADSVTAVDDQAFEAEVLGSDVPVLVDFWAEWCGPCKQMAPALAEIADERAGVLRVVQLDIDANRQTTLRYGVMSIPTLKLFSRGEVVHTVVGATSKSALLSQLDEHLPPPE